MTLFFADASPFTAVVRAQCYNLSCAFVLAHSASDLVALLSLAIISPLPAAAGALVSPTASLIPPSNSTSALDLIKSFYYY